MSAYHIVSLDGGGIRGVLTAALLERLEAAQPGWMAKVDLYAGTSTGGILALGLASGLTPTQARQLYERLGSKVFEKDFLRDIADLNNLIGSDYSNKPLKEELTRQFGEMTLADLPKKVLVSSFDLDSQPSDPLKPHMWKAKFFHNFPGPGSDGDQKVVDVALRTSAAPTYFPIYQGYVDGGVVANNPSMCALAQAIDAPTGGRSLREIDLLSLSTGMNPHFISEQNAEWGVVQWVPHLISLILEGSVGLADYQCRQVLGKRYQRLNPILPVDVPLDKIDQIPLLKEIAGGADISQAVAFVKKYYTEKSSRKTDVSQTPIQA
jgi:patatin-like phospholipase/acyl hydrolase